jgi:4-hydroxy-tetrahydrodipicolinate reductase
MPYRVIQWSTGNVGVHALRGIIDHPDLELAGLWVHSADKVGRDAGELCGRPPTGVLATDDVDALLALGADCVSYTATADLRPSEAVADACRILASGANIVSTSIVPLVWPPAFDANQTARLDAACKAGGTSMFTSGVDPGFANDLLPLVLCGVCSKIESVRVQEILDYATYDQPTVLFETMGFGKPLDHMPLLLLPGVLSYAWGGTIGILAAGLGVDVDEIREWHERRAAPETFSVPSGTIDEGTTAALRFEVQGIVGGEPRIVVEHVTRMREDLVPEWPSGHGQGFYRVIITGTPSITVDLVAEDAAGDHNEGNLVITVMRCLNAIPAVCAAPPGLISTLDLPLITGRGLLGA